METPSVKGYRYFITFTDDFSRYTHLGLCKLKDDALGIFKSWLARAEKETGKSLKVFQSDGGGEFTSGAFKAFLDEKGIKREVTNAYTPQENGVSECANQTLNNLAHSMMADAKGVLQVKLLLPNLWSHAVCHAAWIKNHIPSQSLY